MFKVVSVQFWDELPPSTSGNFRSRDSRRSRELRLPLRQIAGASAVAKPTASAPTGSARVRGVKGHICPLGEKAGTRVSRRKTWSFFAVPLLLHRAPLPPLVGIAPGSKLPRLPPARNSRRNHCQPCRTRSRFSARTGFKIGSPSTGRRITLGDTPEKVANEVLPPSAHTGRSNSLVIEIQNL